jgi:flavin reductase (DIM6/NTAB) family NADH-FMN oxidoreductase RutF
MPVDTGTFRNVFRRWPSGLAVVTSRHRDPCGDLALGMVVSSFCSLSANPPRVMFSASPTSRTGPVVDRSGIFAVSILGHGQRHVFERFAGLHPGCDDDRFVGLETIAVATGAPIFPDALAWVDCRVVDKHRGEGYTIFVGEVVDACAPDLAEPRPLVYFRRELRCLSAEPLA